MSLSLVCCHTTMTEAAAFHLWPIHDLPDGMACHHDAMSTCNGPFLCTYVYVAKHGIRGMRRHSIHIITDHNIPHHIPGLTPMNTSSLSVHPRTWLLDGKNVKPCFRHPNTLLYTKTYGGRGPNRSLPHEKSHRDMCFTLSACTWAHLFLRL